MLEELSEYFVGTKTHRDYNRYRAFFREYCNTDFEQKLTSCEVYDLCLAKAVPNILQIAGGIMAIFFEIPFQYSILVEFVRYGGGHMINLHKEKIESIMDGYQKLEERNYDQIDQLMADIE